MVHVSAPAIEVVDAQWLSDLERTTEIQEIKETVMDNHYGKYHCGEGQEDGDTDRT